MPASALAPLAFGDHYPNIFNSVASAQEEAFRLLPGLKSFDFLDRSAFQFKTVARKLSGLFIGGVSTPDCQIHFGDRKDPAFVFPVFGHARFEAEGNSLAFHSAQSAVLMPAGIESQVTGEKRSVAVAQLNAIRLQSTLTTMLGENDKTQIPDHPMAISLVAGQANFDLVFRSIFTQIDALSKSPGLLEASGLDDVFYRTLLLAAYPEAFALQAQLRETPKDRRRLARVCEYVAANLGGPISLTDLERVGHMSRKTLYNAFVKATAMSPAAWVREQRLQKARGLLTTTVLTVTEALLACGFTHPSQFAAIYARRFGELPSATSKRKQD